MAFNTNYTALLAELQTYVEDDTAEFQAELPNIINRAVDMVQLALNFAQWRTTIATTTGVNVPTMTRPALLRIESVFLGSAPLEQRSYQYCQMFNAGVTATVPRYWCEKDVLTESLPNTGEIVLAPTPNQAYAIEFAGMQRLAALSPSNATNWITDNTPELLFTAALAESELYLQAPERAATILQVFEQRLALLRGRLQGTGVELYAGAQ